VELFRTRCSKSFDDEGSLTSSHSDAAGRLQAWLKRVFDSSQSQTRWPDLTCGLGGEQAPAGRADKQVRTGVVNPVPQVLQRRRQVLPSQLTCFLH
jgi:hypothetical protein